MMLRSTRRGVLLGSAATAASIGAPWVWRHGPAQAAPAAVVDPRFTAPVVNPAAIPPFVSALPDTGASWVPIDLRGGGSTTIQVKAKPDYP